MYGAGYRALYGGRGEEGRKCGLVIREYREKNNNLIPLYTKNSIQRDERWSGGGWKFYKIYSIRLFDTTSGTG